MAANILIYGNDIGDTARNDLARAQIMDQRSRDAAAQRQNTTGRMQQNKQFGAQLAQQEDQFGRSLDMRGRELQFDRESREDYRTADREARLQIAEEQRETALIESARRAAESGMLSEDDLNNILPQVGPRAQSYLKGLAETMRRDQQRQYDMLQSEADRLNALRAKDLEAYQSRAPNKPGFGFDSWGYRTQKEAAEQNMARQQDFDAQAARELGSVDPDLRFGLRYDPATGKFAPSVPPPTARTGLGGGQQWMVDPMTIPSGGVVGPDAGMLPPQSAAPQRDPMAPAAAAAPPAIDPQLAQLMSAVGLSVEDIPVVQNIIAQLAPQVGVDQAVAIAIDRVSKEKVRGMQQQLAPPPAMAPAGPRLNPNSGFAW